MAAIRSLLNLNTAQVRYRSAYGRYVSTLAELGPPDGGIGASASRADLIPAGLASGMNSGYRFTLSSSDAGYVIPADPQRHSLTGRRSFYTDASGTVRERRGNEPATARDPEVK